MLPWRSTAIPLGALKGVSSPSITITDSSAGGATSAVGAIVSVGLGGSVGTLVGEGIISAATGVEAGLHAETSTANITAIKYVFISLLFIYSFGRSPM
jgi:hypothetical protein